MNGTWWHECHPPHLIIVAMLPCESQNTENVIWQCDITQENCIKCICIIIDQIDQGHVPYICLFGVLCSNACTKQRFVTLTTCENTWCKLCLTLNRTLSTLWLTSDTTVWDRVGLLVVDTLNTCSEINVHLCDSSEYFMKLSMYFDAFNSYIVVHIKSWICVHMHFRSLNFHKIHTQPF